MITAIQPYSFNQNINFGAKIPYLRSNLAENKKAMQSMSAAIGASLLAVSQLYGNGENLKTKQEMEEITGLDAKKLDYYTTYKFLNKSKGRKGQYDINDEQNKAFLYRVMGRTISLSELANLLDVNMRSLRYYDKNGALTINEDGLIDLSVPENRYFCEKFNKYKRTSALITEKDVKSALGDIPLEYCVRNGLFKTDENGKVIYADSDNQAFLRKCKDREIRMKTFVVSLNSFSIKADKTIPVILNAIKKGKINMTEDGRFDIYDSKNAEYLKQCKKTGQKENGKYTLHQLSSYLGYNSDSALRYYINQGLLVRGDDNLFDINIEPNKSLVEKKLNHAPKRKNYNRIYRFKGLQA